MWDSRCSLHFERQWSRIADHRRPAPLPSTMSIVMLFLILIMTVATGCSPDTNAPRSQAGAPRDTITVTFIGTTNGVVGITNGSWAIYSVTNHTTNSFLYLGSKIEIKRGNTWVLDPALEPTEIGGWLSPPTLTWHDAVHAFLDPTGRFHVSFRAREDSAEWRASLRFISAAPAGAVPAFPQNATVVDGFMQEARDRVHTLRNPARYYDCPIPEPQK